VNGSRLGGEAAPSRLYHNRGDGTFADVSDRSGLDAGAGARASAPATTTTTGAWTCSSPTTQSVLYRNQGGGVFGDVTRPAGLVRPDRYSTGCAFLDYDRDGRLDLFVSAYLAQRTRCATPGHGRTELARGRASSSCAARPDCAARPTSSITARGRHVHGRLGARRHPEGRAFLRLHPLVLDYDNDGWPDVYVANDSRAAAALPQRARRHLQGARADGGAALTADGRAQAAWGGRRRLRP